MILLQQPLIVGAADNAVSCILVMANGEVVRENDKMVVVTDVVVEGRFREVTGMVADMVNQVVVVDIRVLGEDGTMVCGVYSEEPTVNG